MEVKDRITYIYDFGDDWKHSITLIKITPLKVDGPFVTSGKGKCPPEDCGGIWGYEGLIDTVNDPKNPEYEDMREWLGMDDGDVWNVHEFDMDGVNKVLKRV